MWACVDLLFWVKYYFSFLISFLEIKNHAANRLLLYIFDFWGSVGQCVPPVKDCEETQDTLSLCLEISYQSPEWSLK